MKGGEIIMTTEQNQTVIHIRPNGPQGGGFGVEIHSKDQLKDFDDEVGQLPIKDRKRIDKLRGAAERAKLRIVDN